MGRLILEIIEDNYSRSFTSALELSILLGVDSFTYMISDGNNQSRLLKDYTLEKHVNQEDEVKNILSSDKQLNAAFRSVLLGIDNPHSTLIPTSFYHEKERRSYLEHLMPLVDQSAIFTDSIDGQSAQNVYAVKSSVLSIFEEHLPGFHILHFSSVMMRTLESHAKANPGHQVYVYFRPRSLRIFLFDNGRIKFSNSFDFTGVKDVLYYVLLVLEQHGLDNTQTPVFLLGQLLRDSELFRLLYRYIDKLFFFEHEAPVKMGSKLGKMPSWFFYDVLSLNQ
ncbi:MAG: DUF3822 family protein [Saprospiraceae bacterium]|nr:DUF3822 family protein [Saprospiraceae bacterium]MCB9322925.1 DUF3822 family protein [Lewinellaceae bacterium]